MMKRMILRAAAVACALALPACADETPKAADLKPAVQPAADLNKPLVERVRQALARERDIPGDDIDVTAYGGVVSLWGRVSSAKESRRAEQIASGVEGVQRVENKLKTD